MGQRRRYETAPSSLASAKSAKQDGPSNAVTLAFLHTLFGEVQKILLGSAAQDPRLARSALAHSSSALRSQFGSETAGRLEVSARDTHSPMKSRFQLAAHPLGPLHTEPATPALVRSNW